MVGTIGAWASALMMKAASEGSLWDETDDSGL
jgi:hypothetical protein